MASFATKKIFKAAGSPVSALEEAVAKAFMELEITSKEMSAELRDLYFLSAKEVEAPGNKTAIIVFVPFRQHKKFQVSGTSSRDMSMQARRMHFLCCCHCLSALDAHVPPLRLLLSLCVSRSAADRSSSLA